MTIFKNRSSDIFILIPILLIGLLLRIYQIPSMVGFDFDQEYAAMFANTILNVYPIQMIGQGLSVQGLFMGPLYFYFLVPFFALFQLHPIGGYIGSIVLELGGTVIIYLILRSVFGITAGIIGALLSSMLLLYIQYSWAIAPAYSSVFIIFLTWFCFYKYWHDNSFYLPLLAFIFGMYTSFHPIHFPFYFLLIFMLLIKRKIPSLKIIIASIVLFTIPLAPLLLFEYYRHFLELKILLSLHITSGVEPKTLGKLIEYAMILFRFPMELLDLPLKGIASIAFSCLFYLSPCIFTFKKIGFWKDRFHVTILFSTIATFLTYYYFLPTHVPEYYFIGVETIIFLYFSASLALLATTSMNFLLPTILTIIVFFNISSLVSLWRNPPNISLASKEYILLNIKEHQKQNPNFAISYNIDYGQQYGFGYLTRLFHIDPKGEPETTYEIVLPVSRTKEKLDIISPSGGIGVVIHNRVGIQ